MSEAVAAEQPVAVSAEPTPVVAAAEPTAAVAAVVANPSDATVVDAIRDIVATGDLTVLTVKVTSRAADSA